MKKTLPVALAAKFSFYLSSFIVDFYRKTSNTCIRIWMVSAFLLFYCSNSFGQTQTTETFNATTTWICPSGVTSISVECWGGGGAGGGATGNPAAGGGGAGAAYAMRTLTVVPGTAYTVTVGTGGTGGTGNGGAGGSSWFSTNTTILAVGGGGGNAATSNNQTATGQTAAVSGNVGGTTNFYGGNGGTGGASGASGGGGGGSAGTNSDGIDAVGITGGTAVTGGGAGGNGSASSADGVDNTNLGAGGPGARAGSGTDRNGGNGGAGQVVITTSALWSNPLTGSITASTTSYATGNVVAANVSITGVKLGPGLAGVAATGQYRADGFPTGAMVAANDYYEFALTPGGAYYIDYTSFDFNGAMSAGTATYALWSSYNSYASAIGTGSLTITPAGFSVPLTALPVQSSITTFRLYIYTVTAAANDFIMSDFSFIGDVLPKPTITSISPCGSIGSKVVIAGTNFTGATAVTVGGVNAPTFTVESSTLISATVPAGAVDGVVTVTNGTVATSAASFDVVTTSVLSGCPASFSVNTSTSVPGDCLGAVSYTAPTYTATCGTGLAMPGMTYLGTFGGNYYYRSTGSYIWTDAKANAALYGGKLAVISSSGENAQLLTWLSASGLNYWIGFTDATTEGTFLWDAGSPANYTNWNPGEPNDTGVGEDYTEFVSGAAAPGKWNDNSSIIANPYILEMGMFQTSGTITTGMNAAPGAYPITYQAILPGGPSNICSFTVTVVDNEKPTLTCSGNVTVNTAAGSCTATVTLTAPTTADNCGVLSVVSDHPSTTYPLGVTTVSWIVTDIHSNTGLAPCTQTVTVTDNIVPTITCPSNINQPADAGLCTYTTTPSVPTYADNCSVAALTWVLTGATTGSSAATGINTVPSTAFNTGVTTVTYTVKDAANLTATCSFTVTVTELIAPTVTCPSNYTANTGVGTCTASVATANPTAADNCGVVKQTWALSGVTAASSPATGINNVATQTFNLGVTTVTYTVYDVSGNTGTCSYTVTVSDNIAPVIVSGCPGTQTLALNSSCQATLQDYRSTIVKSDNCTAAGSITLTQSPAPGTVVSGAGTVAVSITASDANGNTSSPCTFNVTKTDAILPTISCPANITANADPGLCTTTISLGTPTTADNCSVASVTNNHPSTTFSVGLTTVVWTVTDGSGNTAQCSQTVSVIEAIAPTISCPAAQSLALNASCAGTLGNYTSLATISDNCTATGSLTVTQSPASGTAVSGVGTTVVTLTVSDYSGNQAQCTFNVNRIDNILPVITCPGTQTLALNASCAATLPDYTSLASKSDNCTASGSITITQSPAVGSAVSGVGTTVVTLTATDASGNQSNCTFNVSRIDNIAPSITCPGAQTLALNASCSGTLGNYTSLATKSDNCTASGSITVTQSPAIGSAVSGVGTTVVTLTATDASANQGTCTFSVNRVDNIVPVITCPGTQTLVLNASCAGSLGNYTGLATKSDNCTAAGSIVVTQSPASGTAVSGVGTTAVTLTATDASGNQATCNFNVSRVDQTAPTFTTCPTNVSPGMDATICGKVLTPTQPVTTDNCGVSSLTWALTGATTASSGATGINYVPSTTFNAGVTTVTYTAKDASNNTTTCAFTITVTDNQAPIITNCPASQVNINTSTDGTGNCLGTIAYTLNYTENCGLGGAISGMTYLGTFGGNYYYRSNSNYMWNNAKTDAINKGGRLVNISTSGENAQLNTWLTADYWIGFNDIATEGSFVWDYGNALYTNWQTGQPDNGGGTEDRAVFLGATGFWNDDDEAFIDFLGKPYIMEIGLFQTAGTVTVGSVVSPGTYPQSYSAVGPGGTSATCSFNVVVADNENPVVVCPGTQTLNLNASCAGSLPNYTSLATKSDNCTASGSITLTQSPVAGTAVSGVGTTVVTLTATDASGNQGTCNFNVNRVDVINPTITCPANINVNVNSGACTATVASLVTPTTADNCAVSSVTNNHPSTTYALGINTVIWTATDASGNTATCNQTVTVTDNINPTITCPTNITINVNGASCTGTLSNAALGTPVTSDNCSVASVTNNHPSNSYFGGVTNVTWTVTDGSGNTATCIQTVTVVDNVNPTIICPANISVNVGVGTCTATVASLGTPVTADNCTVLSVVNNHPSTTYPLGVTNVIWTVTDGTGNINTCTQTVTVIDNINPTITCPANISVNVDAGQCTAMVASLGTPTTGDNCTVASIVNNHVSTTYPLGITTATWTVTDGSGNTATCTQTVTVNDNINPTIVCPSTQTLILDGTCSAVLPDYTSVATIGDNCTGTLIVTQSPVAGTNLSGVGTTTVTLIVTDPSGNTASCNFAVNREDQTDPSITCPADQALALDNSSNATIPDYASLALISDNCTATGSLIITQSPVAGTILTGPGTTVVTMTVSDMSGNDASCSFNVVREAITMVQLGSASGSFADGAGSFNIPVTITNPSAFNATTIDLVLTSGSADAINGYTTQTVTFPAGSNTTQNIQVVITNNDDCDDLSNLAFQLQSVTGGSTAEIGSPASYALTITDDDLLTPVLLTDDFEDGDLADWTMPSGEWTASNSLAINGTYSMHHVGTGNPGQSWVTKDMDDQVMSGVKTLWRFNVNHFGNDPQPSDNFMIYLSSDRSNLLDNPNGYALAIDPGTPGNPDLITLWTMVNGVETTAVVPTVVGWNTSFDKVGFEIERDEVGMWTLRMDTIAGGFDNLYTLGSGTDNQFKEIAYFGAYYKFNFLSSGDLAIDDIAITQEACPAIWYSQSTGNSADVLWSHMPVGTAESVYPSPYHDFVVQAGHSVSINDYFVAKDLVIENSGVISLGSNKIMVLGDMDNQGTFNSDDGTIIFHGKVNQTVTSASNVVLNNVVINNHDFTVTLPTTSEVIIKPSAVISVERGTLETSDRLTLKSNSLGTASIGEISDFGYVTGEVNMERYIPALTNYPYGSWVALGTPVQGGTLSDWNDDIITTGFLGSDYPPPYAFNNIQWYDETVAGDLDNGYQVATTITDPLLSDHGYFVYMQTPTQAMDVEGEIYQHSFDKPLSYTNTGDAGDGWNLFVNQYPSEVDFRQMVLNGSGVASYYLFNSEANNFKVYNGMAQVGTAPRYIASSQAYFVQASGPGSYLRYQENFKTNNGTSFERDLPEDSFAGFKITSSNNSSDESILYFTNGATSGFEWMYDALKMESVNATATELALVATDDRKLSIDARPMETVDVTIPVYVEMPVAGTYTFEVFASSNIPLGTCVYIEDTLTGNTMPVEAGQSWTMVVSAPYTGNRFLIHVSPMVDVNITDVQCNNAHDGLVEVDVPSGEWTITLMDAFGMPFNTASSDVVFDGLEAGTYQVQVINTAAVCPASSIEVSLGEPEASVAELLNTDIDHCNISSDGSLQCGINNLNGSYNYSLLDEENNVINSGTSEETILEIFNLEADTYTLVIDDGCTTQSFEVDVRDPDFVSTEILSEDIDIIITEGSSQEVIIEQSSSGATSYQWVLAGETETSGEMFTYTFDTEGEYTLELIAANEHCSAIDTMNIIVQVTVGISKLEGQGSITMIQEDDALTFNMHSSSSEETVITIFDITGKTVWSIKTSTQEGRRITAGLGQVAAGTYVAHAMTGNREALKVKFIKP